MPNWCMNELRVFGPAEDLDRFRNAVQGKDEDGEAVPLSFASLVPMPKALADDAGALTATDKESLRHRHGDDNWRDWALRNWGCKWDNDSEMDVYEHEALSGERAAVTYVFTSPNAPPEAFYATASSHFPSLTFSAAYNDGGQRLFGGVQYRSGEAVNRLNVDENNPASFGQPDPDRSASQALDENDIRLRLMSRLLELEEAQD